VTYVHEVHAQFAKEAMACQSLDNDEILNVRWATEDPNPVQKVAEKRRIEELGQDAIRARMDPKIVDAMRAVRALEDADQLLEDEHGDSPVSQNIDEDGEPEVKKQRLEVENEPSPPTSEQTDPSKPPDLLNSDALQGLQYFAEIRKRSGARPAAKAIPKPASTGLSLVDYSSDED
jgi:hypothetical protein